MKTLKLITTSILVCFTLQVSAQLRPGTKVPKRINTKKVNVKKPVNPRLLNQNLNYYQIEHNIKNNKKCYSINSTINVVDNEGKNFVGYGNASIQLKDSHFFIEKIRYTGSNGSRGALDVAIPPKTDLHANIDKNEILVSYYGSLGSRDFKLKDVKIIRSKTNILITGSVKVRGTSFSVSISILQADCLI